MNPEWQKQKIEKQEAKINIGDVYFSEGLKSVFEKEEFENEILKINKEIEKYLGENKNSAVYDFRIYDNRKEYEEYFRTNYPEKSDYMENDMVFYSPDEKHNKNVIAKFMEQATLDPNDLKIRKYLEKEKIKFDELEALSKQNYKNNIYPTIAHELTHSHPFFKGMDNKSSRSKWEQEMVCVFIDQKMWEEYVPSYGKMIRTKAKDQSLGRDLFDEIIKDFEEGDFQVEDWERLFYNFLENRHGKEKLKDFWNILAELKDKANFERCYEKIFRENLKDAMIIFQERITTDKI